MAVCSSAKTNPSAASVRVIIGILPGCIVEKRETYILFLTLSSVSAANTTLEPSNNA